MEKRSVSILHIILIIMGIIFMVVGSGLLWTSFTMAEGGLVRAPAILFLIIGFVLCIFGIRKLFRTRIQINN